jgi:hypothetical protein
MQIRSVLLLFVLMPALCFTGCENGSAPIGDENGSASNDDDNAITLGSASDLARIGLESAYPPGGVYKLTADIELADWTPLCADESRPFTGTFDGNNKTITIKSFNTAAARQYIGVFGYTEGATIRNTKIAGTITVSWDNPDEKALFFGGLAGYIRNTRVSRCVSQALITATSVQGPVYAGGLAGYAWGATIADSAATGTITADGKGHNSSAGGIAGYNRTTTVDACSATGDVRLTAIDPESRKHPSYLYMIYAGALIGYTGDSSVTSNSYATGNVYASSPYPYAGGLVGYNYGTLTGTGVGSRITASYATGNATAEAALNTLPYAGGLAGYNSGDKTTIDNCYATGTVLAKSSGGLGWAGGITGANANGALVSKSYSVSAVNVEIGTGPLPYLQPDVSEGACAGGIAGYSYFTANTRVENSAALNERINGTAANGIYALHRVVGRNGSAVTTPELSNNVAHPGMTINPTPAAWDKTANGLDGADADAKPLEAAFVALQWDFVNVWTMGDNGYPALKQ